MLNLKQLWNDSELRIVMALSVCLQLFLFVHSVCRLRTKNRWFSYTASLASTSFYSVAAYGLKVMMFDSNTSSVPNELVVMWAPFFLFHLGGASVLNSLNVEDESMWLKKLLYLVSYSLVVIFIVTKSPPNKLLIIVTVLGLLVAIFKNGVLIRTLLLQKNEFSKDSYESQEGEGGVTSTTLYKKMKAYIRNQYLANDQQFSGVSNLERFSVESKWILGGDLYNTFKAFTRTRSLSPELRRISRAVFRDTSTTPDRAFSLLASEFYAMYRAFYLTKYAHSFTINFVLKTLYSLGVFRLHELYYKLAQDLEFRDVDSMITQWVLFSFLMHGLSDYMEEFRNILPRYNYTTWSESMYVMNLVDWCLRAINPSSTIESSVAKFAARWGGEDVVDNIRLQFSVSIKKMDDYSKQIIFQQILEKSTLATNKESAMKIGCLRGDGALRKHSMYHELQWSLTGRDYGEGVILWHIATDLCFARDLSDARSLENEPQLKFCRTISEYMLYLVIFEDKLMAPVVGQAESVFKDTCSEAKKSFDGKSIEWRAEAREQILLAYCMTPGMHRGKSVLYDAIELAKKLLHVPYIFRWGLISDVWIELLSYASYNSTPRVHVEQPGQGGELISMVWLLMNHLGIGKQFWEEDAARPLHHLD